MLVSHHPRPLFVGKAHSGLGHGGDSGAVLEGAPSIDAQGHLDTGLKGGFELRIRGEDLLDHPGLIIDGAGHAATEIERRVQAHQGGGDGIFIDQQYARPALGCCDGGCDTRGARADHHDIGLLRCQGEAVCDRIAIDQFGVGHTASRA